MTSSSAVSSSTTSDALDGQGANQQDVYCIVKFGRTYSYTIPSFSVITVKLRHAVIQYEDNGLLKLTDVFFREDPSLNIQTPVSAMISDACVVDVSYI